MVYAFMQTLLFFSLMTTVVAAVLLYVYARIQINRASK